MIYDETPSKKNTNHLKFLDTNSCLKYNKNVYKNILNYFRELFISIKNNSHHIIAFSYNFTQNLKTNLTLICVETKPNKNQSQINNMYFNNFFSSKNEFYNLKNKYNNEKNTKNIIHNKINITNDTNETNDDDWGLFCYLDE